MSFEEKIASAEQELEYLRAQAEKAKEIGVDTFSIGAVLQFQVRSWDGDPGQMVAIKLGPDLWATTQGDRFRWDELVSVYLVQYGHEAIKVLQG